MADAGPEVQEAAPGAEDGATAAVVEGEGAEASRSGRG